MTRRRHRGPGGADVTDEHRWAGGRCIWCHATEPGMHVGWTRDEMRTTAQALAAEHHPLDQSHGYAGRCKPCGYVRWPCEVTELAAIVLQLLGDES